MANTETEPADTVPQNGNYPASRLGDADISMNFLYRFFCWCSGARLYILRQCPTDYNTFLGIGIVIFLTGILATLSGSYAFYTVFNNTAAAVLFGIFWGVLIFFLDWYLVSSLKKQGNFRRELLMSIPRFVFAFFLAVVIAQPIELKLFESEINAEIENNLIKEGAKQSNAIAQSFGEIPKLEQDNENMALQIKLKETMRNELFAMVISEAEGTSGTGRAGKGSVFLEKKNALQTAEAELGELKSALMPLIQSNSSRISGLREQRDAQAQSSKAVLDEASGFLARMEAMGRLSKRSSRTQAVSIFITLLFLCIESAPIFVKLISSRGAYDRLWDALSEQNRLTINSFVRGEALSYAQDTQAAEMRYMAEAELASKQHEGYMLMLAAAKQECNQKLVDDWKKRELNNIDKNIEQYLPAIESVFNPVKS